MSTRVLLVEASPTPWDVEGRVVGSRPLPLTAEAVSAIQLMLNSLAFAPEYLYVPRANEACNQAAEVIADKFSLKPRDNPDLETISLGLWEGLTYGDITARFPTVFPQWLEHPLTVTPPEGEPAAAAIERIGHAVRRIVRRNRGKIIAMALRPRALQIASGALHGQASEAIAAHLHQHLLMETIDVDLASLKK